jgi:hypothetical protein
MAVNYICETQNNGCNIFPQKRQADVHEIMCNADIPGIVAAFIL